MSQTEMNATETRPTRRAWNRKDGPIVRYYTSKKDGKRRGPYYFDRDTLRPIAKEVAEAEIARLAADAAPRPTIDQHRDAQLLELVEGRTTLTEAQICDPTVADMIVAVVNSFPWKQLSAGTRQNYLSAMRQPSFRQLYPVKANTIKTRHLRQLYDAIAQSGPDGELRMGAARNFISTFSSLWSAAKSYVDLSIANPAEDIKRTSSEHVRAWTNAEIDTVLVHAGEQFSRFTLLALATAQRRGDVAAVTWGPTATSPGYFDGEALMLRQGKTKKFVRVECPAIADDLRAWKAEAVQRALAEGRAVESVEAETILRMEQKDGAMKQRYLGNLFLKERARLGLAEDLKMHGLRATGATRLIAAGIGVDKVMALGGWESLSTLKGYVEDAAQDINARAATDNLAALLPALATDRAARLAARAAAQGVAALPEPAGPRLATVDGAKVAA